MATSLPVWFLRCAGLPPGAEASAAFILVRNRESNSIHSLLVAAQHSMRTEKIQGGYYTEILAWPPGIGYNDQTAIKVTLFPKLSPPESNPWVEPEDLIFLEVPADQAGDEPCRVDLKCDFSAALFPLEIVGFDGGAALINAHRGIVKHASHPNWKLVGRDGPRAIGILGEGGIPPQWGASGGGVFLNGAYVGVYRGMYTKTGQHLFLPLDRVRRWCQMRNFDLINLEPEPVDVQVQKIKTGVDTIAGSNTPGLPALLAANQKVITRLKSNLALFNSYKQLHDGLHQVQFQFTRLVEDAKCLPERQAATRVESLFQKFQEVDASNFETWIGTLPEEPETVRGLENEWLAKFRDAAINGSRALGGNLITKMAVNKSVLDLRGVLAREMPHVNQLLSACARSMKLASLTELFAQVAKLPGVSQPFIDASLAGQESTFRLHQRLLAQVELHTAWQTADESFWLTEDNLRNAKADPETRNDQWYSVKTDIERALARDRSDDLVPDIAARLEAMDQLTNQGDHRGFADQFSLLERDCRTHFFTVDRNLLKLATEVADIEKSLNNLLAQL